MESETRLRSRAEGTRLYISKHPEWSAQFVKYHVQENEVLTEDSVLLLAMVLTEGYTDSTSFGFSNTQEILHEEFREFVNRVYGDVHIGRNGITSRVSSAEIAKDLASLMPHKAFREDVVRFILDSPSTMVRVMRVIASTEGAFLISVRRAKRNFTTESRVVLASSNPRFTRQIGLFLHALGIEHRVSMVGAIISKKSHIAKFCETVGFSSGIKVVREKAGSSLWYGCEKATLQRLFFRVAVEQKAAKAGGFGGAFADCATREQIIRRLKSWYAELNGGGKN